MYNETKLIDFIPYLIAPDEVFVYITPQIVPNVKPYYMISNYGRIYMRFSRIPFMTFSLDSKGYWTTSLSTDNGPKMIRVHRVVKLAFDYIPNHEDFVIDHLDGNKRNPYIGNLEWVTQEENTRRAFAIINQLGSIPAQITPQYIFDDMKRMNAIRDEISSQKYINSLQTADYTQKNFNDLKSNFNCQSIPGEIRNKSSHSDEEVHQICKMLQEGYTTAYIATSLKVKKSYVSSVRYGKARPDISCQYDFSNYGTIQYNDKWLFTPEQIHAICRYMTENDIAKANSKKTYIKQMFAILNIEYSDAKYACILDIYRGRQYKSVTKDYDIRHEKRSK